MQTKERIIEILERIKPTVDLKDKINIIDGGYFDSLEFMGLITELNEGFGISIDIDDIIPENFNSVDAIEKLVERIK